MEGILRNLSMGSEDPAVLGSQVNYWEVCKKRLKNRIPASLYRSLITPLKLENRESSGEAEMDLDLIAPNKKIAERIGERYLNVIQECLNHASFQGKVNLRYEGADGGDDSANRGISLLPDLQLSLSRRALPACEKSLPGLEDLAFSGTNQFEIERLWNSSRGIFLIIGEAGSGKTAIGRAYARQRQKKRGRCRFLGMETFLTEFAQAAGKRDGLVWRSRLRSHQHIVLDDFQYLKPQAARSQEELLHLIDEFAEKDKSLVICSAQPIRNMRLLPALTSRLHSSHAILLNYPPQEKRSMILQQECQKLGIDLPSESIDYLSRRISCDMRKLKSATIRLEKLPRHRGNSNKKAAPLQDAARAQSSLTVSREYLDHLCQDLYTHQTTANPKDILRAVAAFYDIPVETIYGPARDKKYVLARHLAAYLCSECLEMNLREVAQLIGRREHGSVLHARRKIIRLMKEDLFFRHQVEDMILKLQQ